MRALIGQSVIACLSGRHSKALTCHHDARAGNYSRSSFFPALSYRPEPEFGTTCGLVEWLRHFGSVAAFLQISRAALGAAQPLRDRMGGPDSPIAYCGGLAEAG